MSEHEPDDFEPDDVEPEDNPALPPLRWDSTPPYPDGDDSKAALKVVDNGEADK